MKFSTASLAAALVVALAAPAAQALSLTLAPPTTNAVVGDSVTVDLLYDFATDPTIGGGVDLFYDDTILSFVSFTFNPAFPDDPDFRRLPDVLADELNGLAFGEFNGIGGTGVVGSFNFTVLDAGMTTLVLAENDTPAGGFFSAVSNNAQAVDFGTASVTAVPEPQVAAMMGVGLFVTLAWARRRHTRHRAGAAGGVSAVA
jgi:hypothetical protein